ncbi:hypothetical protein CS542_07940 [Pedobacter sp. IW39]|nr:hypothetical protein CS542_07940 [Pedobacter sp. IW39]
MAMNLASYSMFSVFSSLFALPYSLSSLVQPSVASTSLLSTIVLPYILRSNPAVPPEAVYTIFFLIAW